MAGNNYPLQIFVTAYGRPKLLPNLNIPLPDTITSYSIIVNNNPSVPEHSFKVFKNVSGSTTLEFFSTKKFAVNLSISNILGKILYQKTIRAEQGWNKVDLATKEFQPGIYLYSLGNVTRRMVIN
jgi:hypothetical protein